ncbi:hypothetical protein [Rhizobium sp. F40D2]|uniref:hypothetical protein n=1 Tax=Rhizobium sp. F40D2 TaxID=3453141 RepID=UPI003F2228F6
MLSFSDPDAAIQAQGTPSQACRKKRACRSGEVPLYDIELAPIAVATSAALRNIGFAKAVVDTTYNGNETCLRLE